MHVAVIDWPAREKADDDSGRRMAREGYETLRRSAWWYRLLYYTTRLSYGFCVAASLLPGFATMLGSEGSLLVGGLAFASLIVDTIFDPRSNWSGDVLTANLLAIEELKILGQYEQRAPQLEALLRNEMKSFEHLVQLQALLASAHAGAPAAPPRKASEPAD